MVLHKDIVETREKFFNLARKAFPNVGEPGAVWVLSEVLGWDWEKIQNVSIDGFGPQGYRIFDRDSKGNRVITKDGQGIVLISRKWTSEEKRKLRDWWWLLGF